MKFGYSCWILVFISQMIELAFLVGMQRSASWDTWEMSRNKGKGECVSHAGYRHSSQCKSVGRFKGDAIPHSTKLSLYFA